MSTKSIDNCFDYNKHINICVNNNDSKDQLQVQLVRSPRLTLSERMAWMFTSILKNGPVTGKATPQADSQLNVTGGATNRIFMSSKIREQLHVPKESNQQSGNLSILASRKIMSFFYNAFQKTYANALFGANETILRKKLLFSPAKPILSANYHIQPNEKIRSSIQNVFHLKKPQALEQLHTAVINPIYTSKTVQRNAKELMVKFQKKVEKLDNYKNFISNCELRMKHIDQSIENMAAVKKQKKRLISDRKALNKQKDVAMSDPMKAYSSSILSALSCVNGSIINEYQKNKLFQLNQIELMPDKIRESLPGPAQGLPSLLLAYGDMLNGSKQAYKYCAENGLPWCFNINDPRVKACAQAIANNHNYVKDRWARQQWTDVDQINQQILDCEKKISQAEMQMKLLIKEQEGLVSLPIKGLEEVIVTIRHTFLSFEKEWEKAGMGIDRETRIDALLRKTIIRFVRIICNTNRNPLNLKMLLQKICDRLYQTTIITPVAFGPKAIPSLEMGMTFFAPRKLNKKVDDVVEKNMRQSWTETLDQYKDISQLKEVIQKGFSQLWQALQKVSKEDPLVCSYLTEFKKQLRPVDSFRVGREDLNLVFTDEVDEEEVLTNHFNEFTNDLHNKIAANQGSIDIKEIKDVGTVIRHQKK